LSLVSFCLLASFSFDFSGGLISGDKSLVLYKNKIHLHHSKTKGGLLRRKCVGGVLKSHAVFLALLLLFLIGGGFFFFQLGGNRYN
jgi:hypothetical protein